MRKLINLLLVVSVMLILILGLFQLASGPVPMADEPGAGTNVGWNGKPAVSPNVGWNGKEAGYLLGEGGAQPNVGWNGKPAADIAAPDEVVCYDGFFVRPMVGWNG